VRKVRAHRPEVAVIDIRMPPDHTDDGLRAAREIRVTMRHVGIIVLAQFVDEQHVLALRSDGADGIGHLLKDQGQSNRAICEQPVVTERAVEYHVTSIFTKLGLSASGQEHRRALACRRKRSRWRPLRLSATQTSVCRLVRGGRTAQTQARVTALGGDRTNRREQPQ
jgi:DNA-binding NarL/FixJ family response regulator